MQYELTSKAVSVILNGFIFFFSWVIVLCQWNYIQETWMKACALFLPVLVICGGIYAFRANPELYIRITENAGIQEAESRQEEDFAILNEWKAGDTAYRIIYMKDTKVKYIIVDDGGSQVTITPLYNADGTYPLCREMPK
ncbi:MAG: hypothetical protein K2P76_14265 [Lachnospiraceae bacterium]|nr:hypothetical protein [Lachnospiraceae bacterium]MDE6981598.1 hypothetical protein [Lachnospiraceae bacterium]